MSIFPRWYVANSLYSLTCCKNRTMCLKFAIYSRPIIELKMIAHQQHLMWGMEAIAAGVAATFI